VLCTETHTYALKHVGTTNTQLLMPPAQVCLQFSAARDAKMPTCTVAALPAKI